MLILCCTINFFYLKKIFYLTWSLNNRSLSCINPIVKRIEGLNTNSLRSKQKGKIAYENNSFWKECWFLVFYKCETFRVRVSCSLRFSSLYDAENSVSLANEWVYLSYIRMRYHFLKRSSLRTNITCLPLKHTIFKTLYKNSQQWVKKIKKSMFTFFLIHIFSSINFMNRLHSCGSSVISIYDGQKSTCLQIF